MIETTHCEMEMEMAQMAMNSRVKMKVLVVAALRFGIRCFFSIEVSSESSTQGTKKNLHNPMICMISAMNHPSEERILLWKMAPMNHQKLGRF